MSGRHIPKPETTTEVYLAEVLDELRALNAALTPAVEPDQAPAPKPRTRKA